MNQISEELVERTWQEMAQLSPQKAEKLMNKLADQQPLILAYLMASGHEILNEEERGLLLYLGFVVWQIMLRGKEKLPRIAEKMIEEAEAKNIKMLEYLEAESDAGFVDTTQTVLEGFRQPEVLRYVVEALMEEDDEEPLGGNGDSAETIRDEMKGMMMIYLKTVIECFDK